MTRILAFGDVHIGSGQSLGRGPGDRLRDHEAVLERIFHLGGERDVDAFLMAGDLFDGPTITPGQLDTFIRPFERLEGEIPLVAISGNSRHDLAVQETNALAPLRHVPGVTVYSRPALHDLGPVQVACLPWVSPARLVASTDGDVDRDRVNARAAELLVQAASAIADPNIKPTVLMLHGSLSGASLPAGISTDDLREPVIDVEALVDLGFDLIVASHIHVPQAYHPMGLGWTTDVHPETPHANVIYTGSPMPLNFGETSVPHGVWILDVDGKATRAEFVPIKSRPFFQWETVLSDDQGAMIDFGIDHMPDGAIVKLKITATAAQRRRLDVAAIRAALIDEGAHTVKIDVDTIREQRSRVDSVTDELSPLDAFDAWSLANEIEEYAARRAREQMQADLEAVA